MNDDYDDSNAAAMCDVCCYEDNEPMGALGRARYLYYKSKETQQ